jgi:hypothetical protein
MQRNALTRNKRLRARQVEDAPPTRGLEQLGHARANARGRAPSTIREGNARLASSHASTVSCTCICIGLRQSRPATWPWPYDLRGHEASVNSRPDGHVASSRDTQLRVSKQNEHPAWTQSGQAPTEVLRGVRGVRTRSAWLRRRLTSTHPTRQSCWNMLLSRGEQRSPPSWPQQRRWPRGALPTFASTQRRRGQASCFGFKPCARTELQATAAGGARPKSAPQGPVQNPDERHSPTVSPPSALPNADACFRT